MRTKVDENSIISQSEFFQSMSDDSLHKLVNLTSEERKVELEEQKILKRDLRNRKLRIFNLASVMLIVLFFESIVAIISQVVDILQHNTNENTSGFLCFGIGVLVITVIGFLLNVDSRICRQDIEFSFVNAMIKYLEENPEQSDQEPAAQYLQLSKEKERIEEQLKKAGETTNESR